MISEEMTSQISQSVSTMEMLPQCQISYKAEVREGSGVYLILEDY